MAARINELRQTLEAAKFEQVQLDREGIVRSLWQVSQTARNDGTKVRGLEIICKVFRLFRFELERPWDGDPRSLTSAQRNVVLSHLPPPWGRCASPD